jgi:hypothetical protein
MSATLTPPEAAVAPRVTAAGDRADGLGAVRDRTVVSVLLLVFTVIVALTWRKWGMPEGDAGAELTTADLIKHGAVVYTDVRYFYGPLGLYSLALMFKVFGTSLTTAYAFGLLQTAAILGVFYALARRWLTPLAAGLTTAILLAIAFSGTAFDFVLPHTNSATFGILTLLLMLLALSRDRLVLAGIAGGLVGLTRPEFLAVAAGVGAAYVIATWRVDGRRAAFDALWRLVLPAAVIPLFVLGWFATRAGLSNLLTYNLWPVAFLHAAGFRLQQGWMPLDVASVFGVLARATVYLSGLAALLISAERMSSRSGLRRMLALWPLAAFLGGLAVADGLLRTTGVFAGERAAIEGEVRHLILGMSWLPALGFGAFAWAALRLYRGEDSPLGGSWPVDFALTVAAVGLGLRAYNAFTAEGSYAPYYAAPLVLLLGIFHARLAQRRPQARGVILGALGAVALGLATYALVGMYRHLDTPVHTPRGTFVTFASAAPALEATVHAIDQNTKPTDRILAAPIDGGMYFFSDRRPASYELSLLPGLLADRAAETRAIARLRQDHVRLAVLSARDMAIWQTSGFGVGYDKLVGDYLRSVTVARTTIGSLAHPAAGTYPAHGFTVLRLRTG